MQYRSFWHSVQILDLRNKVVFCHVKLNNDLSLGLKLTVYRREMLKTQIAAVENYKLYFEQGDTSRQFQGIDQIF